MGDIKRIANELIRDFGPVVPIAWVLTCYDLGCSWVLERPLRGAITLVIAIFAVSVLYGIGILVLAGESPEKKHENGDPSWTLSQRLVRLLVLIVLMILITVRRANSGLPSDVI